MITTEKVIKKNQTRITAEPGKQEIHIYRKFNASWDIAHSVFQSGADRDGMLNSDMELGINDSHERLDKLFERELKSIN